MYLKQKLRKFYYWLFPRMYEPIFEAEIKYVRIESPFMGLDEESIKNWSEICILDH